MSRFTTKQAAQMSGLAYSTVNVLVSRGTITPTWPSRGPSDPHLFSEEDVLKLRAYARIRRYVGDGDAAQGFYEHAFRCVERGERRSISFPLEVSLV